MKRPQLRTRLLSVTLVVMLVTCATVVAASAYFVHQRLVQSELTRAQAIGAALKVQLERLMSLGIPLDQLQGFEDQCRDAVANNAGLSEAMVVTASGRIVFHNDPERMGRSLADLGLAAMQDAGASFGRIAEQDLFYARDALLSLDGQRLADVVVAFPYSVVADARNEMVAVTLLVSLVLIVFGAVVLRWSLARQAGRPVAALLASIDQLRADSNEPGQRLPSREFDELERVVVGFNRLLDRVEMHERALEQTKDVAVAANKAKNAFLANMSHELRTPLHGVIGMTNIVLRKHADAPFAGHLRKSLEAAKRLLAIIDDVLDLARIESSKLSVEPRPFMLEQMVIAQLDLIERQAEDKGIVIEVDVDEHLCSRAVVGDPLRIGQVLLNLLSNAVKFTDQGRVAVSVRPEAGDTQGAELRFEVADTGIGVAPGDVQRLFKPFEQADTSSARRFGGTGLGLSISARLVELMGGRIGCTPRPDGGSVFWFTVPEQRAAAVSPAVFAEEVPSTLPPELARRKRILLVEDDSSNRLVASAFIDELQVPLEMAHDGERALLALATHGVSVIVMDLQLPGMDGIEVTRLIRAQSRYRDIPIIAMTANVFPEDRERCMAAGMNDFITKPVDPETLLATLSKWLRSAPDAISGESDPAGAVRIPNPPQR